MKSKHNSFHQKTLTYFILFSVTILLLLWVFQIFYLKYSYESYQMENLKQIATSIQKTSITDLGETLEKVAYKNEVCIEYYGDNGTNIHYNTLMVGCALGKNNPTILNIESEFIQSGVHSKPYHLVNEEYETKAYLYGVKLDTGVVFLYNTLEDLSGSNRIMKNQLIYLTIIAIIFACVIAYFLSQKLTGPILDITKRAKKLGSGTKVDFPNYGIQEVDELANVLDHAGQDMMKMDELRRDLMANVSHDLKTPLTMIKAYAEMVRDMSYKDDKKRNDHCNIIMDEVDRLNILVNDILTLSKMQANADEMNIEEFDLVRELDTIVNRYQIIKETEDYKFNIQAPKEAIVLADKQKIDQVLYNLINNAINYTGKDKTVTIKVKKEKDTYLVEIIDTGKGIKPEEINFIWNKYYKNDKNHQRNVVGTGLGLSIVKTILEKHKFEYGVKSVKNKGTTFYFYIKRKS